MQGFVFAILCVIVSGCIPSYLDKYQQNDPKVVTTPKPPALTSPHTYFFPVSYKHMWQAALEALVSDYNIATLDYRSGIITTEWSRIEQSGIIQRNKITVMLVRQQSKHPASGLFVKVYNNTERLENLPRTTWVPEQEATGEIARIINNFEALLAVESQKPTEMLSGKPKKTLAR